MALEDYIREQNANEGHAGAQSRMAEQKRSERDTSEADRWHDGI